MEYDPDYLEWADPAADAAAETEAAAAADAAAAREAKVSGGGATFLKLAPAPGGGLPPPATPYVLAPMWACGADVGALVGGLVPAVGAATPKLALGNVLKRGATAAIAPGDTVADLVVRCVNPLEDTVVLFSV